MSTVRLPPGMQVFERGWLSSNNILFIGGKETCLVDSGYCTHSPQTLNLVQQGLQDLPLDVLVNTHLHSDHCGGNAALQAAYPALQTMIPPGESKAVGTWDVTSLSYHATGQSCPRFRFQKLIQPGDFLSLGHTGWEVHAAAGHDPHSVFLFEPSEKIVISADALWENGFGVVFPELDGVGAFADVASTLDAIERLAPTTVVPGHGPAFNLTSEVIQRSRTRLDYFIRNPSQHAQHAAKVLIKFKMLELQQIELDGLINWALHTPLIKHIHKMNFQTTPFSSWLTELLDRMEHAKVIRRDGTLLLNA